MKITFFIIISFVLTTQVTRATQDYQKPPQFIISHFSHPAISAFKEIIKNAYADLGIKVVFSELPVARGIMELNKGRVDADVVRIKQNVRENPNLIIVEPALYNGELSLICSAQVVCEPSVLNSPSTVIISNVNNQKILNDIDIKATILNNETNVATTVFGMIRKGRVDYVIYGSTKRFREALENEFQVVVLKNFDLHHVINKKHAELLPEIKNAIEVHLATFSLDSINFVF